MARPGAVMYCTECGAVVADDARFCGRCGKRVSAIVPPAPPSAATGAPHVAAGNIRHIDAAPPSGDGEISWLAFVLIIALIFVLSLAFGAFQYPNNSAAENFGYAVGISTISFVIALFASRTSRRKFAMVFAIAWVIVCILSWYGRHVSEESERKNQRLEEAFDSLGREVDRTRQSMAELQAPAATPVDSRAPMQTAPRAVEDTKEALARVMENVALLAKEANDQGDALRREVETLRLEVLLAPENIVTTDGIRSGRQGIQRFVAAIDTYESVVTKYQAESRALLQTLPAREREAATREFDKAQARSSKVVRDYVSIERKIAKIVLEILAVAESQLGSTYVEDGQIYFQSDSALEEYRRHFQALAVAALEEERAVNEQIKVTEEAQARLAEARQLLRKE